MSFQFRNLKNLGNPISVRILKDAGGFVGRECPESECLGYFKLKPGTGLPGRNLPCTCPYCGYQGPSDRFWTPDQIAYARSHAMGQIGDAIHRDLKQLESRHRGGFLRLTVMRKGTTPLHHYREKTLETQVTCGSCTLDYAIYGVFAFCPGCGVHNSQQMLERNLALVEKQVALSTSVEDMELARQLLEDALENCVSAFDGFGRETCRVRASVSKDSTKCESISFQNLLRASKRLIDLFDADISSVLAAATWEVAQRGFMKRHVIAHRAGVVDQSYIDETGDRAAVMGRRMPLDAEEVRRIARATLKIGAALISVLPQPKK